MIYHICLWTGSFLLQVQVPNYVSTLMAVHEAVTQCMPGVISGSLALTLYLSSATSHRDIFTHVGMTECSCVASHEVFCKHDALKLKAINSMGDMVRGRRVEGVGDCLVKIVIFANLSARQAQLTSQSLSTYCSPVLLLKDCKSRKALRSWENKMPQGHSPDLMCPLKPEEKSCLFQSGLCQPLRWSHSKLMNFFSDRLILHWEFYHCNCRQLFAIFFRAGHPLAIEWTAVTLPLKVASNFWMGGTDLLREILKPDYILFKIQVNLFPFRLYLHSL